MFQTSQIQEFNQARLENHQVQFDYLSNQLARKGVDVETLLNTLGAFQVVVPSWALGTGGTRFGRFPDGGEPRNLEEKIQDIGLLHQLNRSFGAVSLHIPWDIPKDPTGIKELAQSLDIEFDAVNSNTFQDQEYDIHSYKFGSLSHVSTEVREQAIAHNKNVIEIGEKLESKSITIWLSDGSSYPGLQECFG